MKITTNMHVIVRLMSKELEFCGASNKFPEELCFISGFHVAYWEAELLEFGFSKREPDHLAKNSVHFAHNKSKIPNP
jgi:hypothetical protein